MPDPGISLADLADAVGGEIIGDHRISVTDVQHDSRHVGPGDLFVAIRGFSRDGHEYVADAQRAGAAAVCVEQGDETVAIPQVVVADTRRALATLAAEVHGRPGDRLTIIGVTGTNGKTTVTHLLGGVLAAAEIPHGLVGTLGGEIAGRRVPIHRTTPEASDLQRLLATMVTEGVSTAVIEVSSHALALDRVAEVPFSVAAFTNLSQDHLDFHGDFETYFSVKASLFVPERAKRAVIWIDDAYGRTLRDGLAIPFTTVGSGPKADVGAERIELRLDGSDFDLILPGGRVRASIKLAGEFNVANALIAAGCAFVAGIDPDAIAAGLATVESVPGRFEPVLRPGDCPAVVVDYAHTPDAVASAVGAARRLCPGRIIVVVGAGGDRDESKRSSMGAAAAGADITVVTSDNPRSEDPAAIVADVATGAREVAAAEVVVELERRAAIRWALRAAHHGDLVLILGKGHEQGQQFADRIEPFDDRVVAREELAAL